MSRTPKGTTSCYWSYMLLLSLGGLLLAGCSELGAQAPELTGAQFTPDGSRVVLTYDVYTVLSYSRSGGSVRRSGYREGFLSVRDARTGEELLAERPEFDGTVDLAAVTNSTCALTNFAEGEAQLRLVDLHSGKERFGPQDLARINGGVRFEPRWVFQDTSGRDGFVFEAVDARVYFIDAPTGKAVQEDGHETIQWNDNPDVLGDRDDRTAFSSGRRRKVVRDTLSSSVDFIDPAFAGRTDPGSRERVPVIHDDAFFVISKSTNNSEYDWVLTCLGRDRLEQRWVADVPRAAEHASQFQAEPLFLLSGDTLMMLTSSSLDHFDANTGRSLAHIPLP